MSQTMPLLTPALMETLEPRLMLNAAADAGGTFYETDGTIVIEAESFPVSGDWVAEDDLAGYKGDGFIRWTGPDYFDTPGNGVMEVPVLVTNAGTYHMRIRNYHDHPRTDLENDVWFRIDDNHWQKVFSSVANTWTYHTGVEEGQRHYYLDEGMHMVQLSGRSFNYRIDRIHLAMDPADAEDASLPESPRQVIEGERKQWHPVAIHFNGPDTSEDAAVNPFTDYRMNVTFTSPTGKMVEVPGYYAADGNAAESGATSGSTWVVQFTPDEVGTWTYEASFRTGSMVAIDLAPDAGVSAGFFDGETGSIEIGATDKGGDDFRGKGMLEYVGEHHFRFAGTGEYFLKSGHDSPENFLGYHEFDGTYDANGSFLHEYANHVGDWNPGDPTWQGGKGKGIIGALNYLSDQGVNSVYQILQNIPGDGQDTWPWTSHTERHRFDVSKLEQWDIVFDHMDAKGIQLHMLTHETENDFALGGDGELNDIRKLYFREMVARFSHHLALIWNMGEESDNTDGQLIDWAGYVRALDPYDHPITVHTDPNQVISRYDGLVGSPYFEATSIQGSTDDYYVWARDLREMSANAGRPWAIYGDENMPYVENDLSNLEELREEALWGNLISGGAGVEWYFGYQSGGFHDLTTEDFRVAQELWDQSRYAVEFFQTYTPFWQMAPNKNLVGGGRFDHCLAAEGDVYAIYLEHGGTVNLTVPDGQYEVWWYDPRTGGALQTGTVTQISGAGTHSLGSAPYSATEDWAILVRQEGGNFAPNVFAGSDIQMTEENMTTFLDATVTDDGLPDPPAAVTTTWSKVSGPGTVTFDDASAVDTNVTFSVKGEYVLRLTASDGERTAFDEITVTITGGEITTEFTPVDDAYIEGGAPHNNTLLKAQLSDPARTSYLKFDLSTLVDREVLSATLKLRVAEDPGSGPLGVFVGSHNNWTESTITSTTAPDAGALIAEIDSTYSSGSTVSFDVASAIEVGALSLIIMPTGPGNDVWFYSSEAAASPVLEVVHQPLEVGAQVAARHVFHNNSVWDGYGWLTGPADDNAIDPSAQPLPADTAPTGGHVTGYVGGVTGVMIDMVDMTGYPTIADVRVRSGASADPASWTDGPEPMTMSVRPGAGVDGSDRISIAWADGSIIDAWVEVTLLAGDRTGLLADEVFTFASLVGDISGDGVVDVADLGVLAGNWGTDGAPGRVGGGDLNGDGTIDVADLGILAGAWSAQIDMPQAPAGQMQALASIDPLALVAPTVESNDPSSGSPAGGEFAPTGEQPAVDLLLAKGSVNAAMPAADRPMPRSTPVDSSDAPADLVAGLVPVLDSAGLSAAVE